MPSLVDMMMELDEKYKKEKEEDMSELEEFEQFQLELQEIENEKIEIEQKNNSIRVNPWRKKDNKSFDEMSDIDQYIEKNKELLEKVKKYDMLFKHNQSRNKKGKFTSLKRIEKVGRITRIGNSKGIIIDKDTLEYLGLKAGDIFKFIIEVIKK